MSRYVFFSGKVVLKPHSDVDGESRFGIFRCMGTTAHCWSSAIDYCSKTGRWLALHILDSVRFLLTLKQTKYDFQMCWTERLFSMFVSQRGRAFLIILHWTANRASFWVLTAAKRLSHAVHPQELCSSQNPHQTARFNLGAICAAWNSRVPIRSLQWNEPTGVATPPNLGQGTWAARVSYSLCCKKQLS